MAANTLALELTDMLQPLAGEYSIPPKALWCQLETELGEPVVAAWISTFADRNQAQA